MKTFVTIIFLSMIMVACNGQKKQSDSKLSGGTNSVYTDTSSNPRINVKVNKKYDSKGNLIRYDSTYSYFFASPNGETKKIGNDSVYNNFKSYFNQHYINLFNKRMNDIFFNDTLFEYDFFNKDYFRKRYEMNTPGFEDIFRQMDSIKMNYLDKSYPKGKTGKKD